MDLLEVAATTGERARDRRGQLGVLDWVGQPGAVAHVDEVEARSLRGLVAAALARQPAKEDEPVAVPRPDKGADRHGREPLEPSG